MKTLSPEIDTDLLHNDETGPITLIIVKAPYNSTLKGRRDVWRNKWDIFNRNLNLNTEKYFDMLTNCNFYCECNTFIMVKFIPLKNGLWCIKPLNDISNIVKNLFLHVWPKVRLMIVLCIWLWNPEDRILFIVALGWQNRSDSMSAQHMKTNPWNKILS